MPIFEAKLTTEGAIPYVDARRVVLLKKIDTDTPIPKNCLRVNSICSVGDIVYLTHCKEV